MKAFVQILIGLLAALLLTACGGGGGGGSNEGGSFTPSELRVTFDAVSSAATPSSVIPISVRVTNGNGTAVADGTSVSLSVTPSDLALVSSFIAPPGLGATTTTTTRGGVAQFRLHTRATGTVTLRATATGAVGGSSTATLNVNIVAGPGNDQRLTITTQGTSLPANPTNQTFGIDSPFVSRTDITFRRLDGTLVNLVDGVSVAVLGGIESCSFSTLDDPATTDINEALIQLSSGPVDVTAGIATIFVRSRAQPGQCTIVVTGQDAQTGETISVRQTFTIVGGLAPTPTAVFISENTGPLFVQGSGGLGTVQLAATVLDGNNRPVANAAAGINNVRVEIVSGPGGGERLIGVNAAGASVSGNVISVRTTNGILNFNLVSGNRTGPVVIRVTADRTDNNVDNGIQDPVTATRTIIISDGRLFDLDITNQNALVVDNSTPVGNPVYQLTITVIATDRDGNPVIPGTQIDFGLIDTPLAGNEFAIMGSDGNPLEGGNLFTAPTGNFGLAGPGDTLVIFAEEIPGQRDMEAARTIQQITSINSLLVNRVFNRNDTTGVIVDGGPIFPYVIGRAANGNITASATTNEFGVATAILRYSQAQVGRPIIVFAQGGGFAANGTPSLVADVERLTFAAVGPAVLTAAPGSVAPNTMQNVRLCLRDTNDRGIPGAIISFTTNAPANGQVFVDGRSSPGTVATPTGADGCTVASIQSQNLLNSGATITFRAGGAQTDVVITPPGGFRFTVQPNSFSVSSGPFLGQVLVQLLNPTGTPIEGAAIGVTCTPPNAGSLTATPGTTGPDGSYFSLVQGNGFVSDPDGPPPENPPPGSMNMPPINRTGTCVFTVTGNPTLSATLTVNGNGRCAAGAATCP